MSGTSAGLLSVKFCFTAGDHVIIIQPSPSATTDTKGKVHLSSAALCCLMYLAEPEAVFHCGEVHVVAASNTAGLWTVYLPNHVLTLLRHCIHTFLTKLFFMTFIT